MRTTRLAYPIVSILAALPAVLGCSSNGSALDGGPGGGTRAGGTTGGSNSSNGGDSGGAPGGQTTSDGGRSGGSSGGVSAAGSTGTTQPRDAGVADSGSKDTGAADLGSDVGSKAPDASTALCTPGSVKCDMFMPATCDATGAWKNAKSCPYVCLDGACTGTCRPGNRQCQGNTVQACNASGVWEDSATCAGVCSAGGCVESCVAGQQRCKDLVPQTCSSAGMWQDNRACLYQCSAGACTGECTPGNRRCQGNTVQTCGADARWVDQQACTGSSPTCASGQCVATCLATDQDCTDPKTTCCQGSECASADGGKTSTCRAVPACTALGNACKATSDCCASLDCTGGKCAARPEGCSEQREDATCSGATAGICCPGLVCIAASGSPFVGCNPPTGTHPQDATCLRDQPGQHEPCSSARFGLSCTYSYWATLPGIFYTCTCSYHGWNCIKGYYVW
jgi:hypothetical protein